ncbi:MAG: phospho-N-acetylmuramoyl-pentapeptide-transferase [Desulfurivibrio sp.]|nr:phospho-N-acetylmuramoyl-pentapeptide-transferase [Desulfurivibrio sp.]
MLYHFLYSLHEQYTIFNVFRYITFRGIGAALTAFMLVMVLGPYFIAWLKNRQIGQVVREDGPESHYGKRGVPTMGGLLILTAVVLTTLLWVDLANPLVWLILGVMLWFGVIGAYDDYRKIRRQNSKGLGVRGKLLLQAVGAGGAILALYLLPDFSGQLSFPFFKEFRPDLGSWYCLFALLVVVGASNAVNLTDGLDGLVTGPVVITGTVYLLFSYLAGHAVLASYLQIPHVPGAGEVAVFTAALVGASLGFLWFNTYPAQVFMGDVGSLAIGAALGMVAIITKQEFLLAIVGGIFVMEALSVMLQVGFYKLSGGQRIFLMAPFHHHFEKKGWQEPKVVVRFWIISIVLGLVALATLKLR